MSLITRGQWRARPPKATPTRVLSTRGVKIHYTGDHVSTELIHDHDMCVIKVRRIQDGHMDANGWNDLGYTGLVCPHGHLFVGRGPHVLCAANGEGLNRQHYALCGLVGSKGLVEPTPAMLHGLVDGIEWLRAEGKAGREVLGHRDGYATDCPGTYLYRWVREGARRPETRETDMTPDTRVQISRDFDGQYSQDNFSAGYLWQAGPAEVRKLKAEVAARLDAQDAKLDAILAKLSP